MSKGQNQLPQICVNMLGEFTVSVDGKVVLEDQGQSRKVWNLFAYLIANRERILSPTELPELLCSDERSDDPAKAVKNLVYRLRCLIGDSQMPEANYIVQKGGVYRWNPEIPITFVGDEFSLLWKEAKKAELDDEKIALEKYLQALHMYGGRFLPRFIYEEWTVGYATQYQRVFLDCLVSAFNILDKKEEYDQIIPICEKAIGLDPFDEEVYKIYISALIKMGKQKEALAAYEAITGRLYTEMGVNPSKELMLLYRSIMKSIKSIETDLMAIKEDLNEQGSVDGTYCCEYEIFKDIYRFVARGVGRTGESIFIMLCTITDQNDAMPPVEHVSKAMEKLKVVISEALRKGDLFAQYSCTQYVLMLPCTSYENGMMVGDRIMKAYKKLYTSKYVKLHYKLQPLDPKVK